LYGVVDLALSQDPFPGSSNGDASVNLLGVQEPAIQSATRAAITAGEVSMVYHNGKHTSKVLEEVNLDIAAGEFVLLSGPSGSGKSTLLSILGCILTPSSGSVKLFDHEATEFSPVERTAFRRDKIGFIFQRFNLIRGLTALENICVPLALQSHPRQRQLAEARLLLEQVGLAEFENMMPNRMSGGQCQRVAIARALACKPQLILADEPTASLDGASGERVMALLKTLVQERGTTLFAVTHDQRIFPFADRILVMENGQIADEFRG
jgi:putative ABC transport system ATP-binding protein